MKWSNANHYICDTWASWGIKLLGISIVYWRACSGLEQRKQRSSALLFRFEGFPLVKRASNAEVCHCYDVLMSYILSASMGLFPDMSNCGLRMRRERFPRHRGLAIATSIMACAWRTCRDACRDCYLAVSFEVSGGENISGILGACATRKFTYLVRCPLWRHNRDQSKTSTA